jgi:hypothetical protein
MPFRNFLKWRPERRRSPRFEGEDLVAYYWTGAVPDPRIVRQIGMYGARIIAPEGFYPGTMLQIVFEDRAANSENGDAKPHICVCTRTLRTVEDGFCVAFLFTDVAECRGLLRFLSALTRKTPPQAERPEAGKELEKVAGTEEEGKDLSDKAGDEERKAT